MPADLDALCVNTIRTLSIDAIQKARSGHPGTPMGMAPVAYLLSQRFLRFDPQDPIWPTATGSSCLPATPRCSCTRSCT